MVSKASACCQGRLSLGVGLQVTRWDPQGCVRCDPPSPVMLAPLVPMTSALLSLNPPQFTTNSMLEGAGLDGCIGD